MNREKYAEIEQFQEEIRQLQKKILALRAALQPEEVEDAEFDTKNGRKKLSDFFGESHELLVIHNMGRSCSYCSLWADGINGFIKQIGTRVPLVLISPDDTATQQQIAAERNWQMEMASDSELQFTTAMGFYTEKEGYYPGVSAFKRENGKIYRVNYDYFGPGDSYASIWHFFDLLPQKTNGWQPIRSV